MTFEWQLALARLGRGLLVLLRAAFLGLAWILSGLLMRLRIRTRVAVVIATLVVVSGFTASAAPSLSATANGLAVLLVAGCGLWVIVRAPFRRRDF